MCLKCHLKKHDIKALANFLQELSDFLCTYRNVPHSTTHLVPIYLMLTKAPCTHLAMTSPNVASYVRQQLVPSRRETIYTVRKFNCGDRVMVRNFSSKSTSEWQRGTVVQVLEELTYQVNCEGYRRQVHIDHLLPAPTTDKLDKHKLTGQDDSQIAESTVSHTFLS